MKFNIDKLLKLLKADTNDILSNPNKYWNFKFQNGNRYLYVDRGAEILAVAHLDTVADGRNYGKKAEKFSQPSITKAGYNDIAIGSIALDDRLGVFMLMDVLPYLGLRYDILLTTDEEIGMSTAMYFNTRKEYNWIFEIDRRDYGTVVLYDFETKEARTALQSLDYKIETGSFSDICHLDQLGCVGFNFGAGYKYEHTNSCYTRTSWMNVVVQMFVDFYKYYSDTYFPYVPKPKTTKWYGNYYDDRDYSQKSYGGNQKSYGGNQKDYGYDPKYTYSSNQKKSDVTSNENVGLPLVNGFSIDDLGKMTPISIDSDGTITRIIKNEYEDRVECEAEFVRYITLGDGTQKRLYMNASGEILYTVYEPENIETLKGKSFVEINGELQEFDDSKCVTKNNSKVDTYDYSKDKQTLVEKYLLAERTDEEAFWSSEESEGSWDDCVDDSDDYNDRFVTFAPVDDDDNLTAIDDDEFVDSRISNPDAYLHPEDFRDLVEDYN